MPRPVQLTSPLPTTLITGFGGPANTNLLPTIGGSTGYSPFLWNPPVAGSSNLIPVHSTVTIGKSLQNIVSIINNVPVNSPVASGPVVFNRNLIITSTANVSGGLITLIGRDANHQPVTETLTGPAALGNVTSVNEYAYLDYFGCYTATPNNNFDLAMGLSFTTCPVRLDYFYPNTACSVSGQVFGTGATYTIFATIQKITLFNNQGIPYTNPEIFWHALDASVTAATTDIIYSFNTIRSAVYASCILGDDTSSLSFTVLQQGVR